MHVRVFPSRTGTALAAAIVLFLASFTALSARGEDGNIAPGAIEIDSSANLYPSSATGCSGNAFNGSVLAGVVDWVKDCLANPGWAAGSVAAQKGHLNGFRVLDGVAGDDQDIFLTGGKENDVTSWNPGPGSVGSSKYDITQAYIANNTTDAFFGMERRGNNGTTAFDWEFNKLAPSGSAPSYIPNRSENDVLVTFEMQGSGGSGSATPFRFRYDDPDVATSTTNPPADTDHDGSYVPTTITGIQSTINNAPVASAPWGTVDSKGSWVTDPIDRFQFAEAKVPLSLLGVDTSAICAGASRFVQVRTRASSTDNSDLKDLTKIFDFTFVPPQNPTQTLAELCDAKFTFASSVSTGSMPSWRFDIPDSGGQATGVDLAGEFPTVLSAGTHDAVNHRTRWTASAFSGTVGVTFPAGQDSVTIQVSQALTSTNGCDTGSTGSIVVHRGLGVTASLTPHCGNLFDYGATSTGGTGTKSFSWSIQKQGGGGGWTEVATRTGASGSIDMDTVDVDPATPGVQPAGQGTYRGIVTVTDQADSATGKPACTASVTTTSVTVFDDVAAAASGTPDCDGTFPWGVTVTGGMAPYDVTVAIQRLEAGVWVTKSSIPELTGSDGTESGTYDATGAPGQYRVHVTAEDSQTPACTATTDSTPFQVRDALTASASKDAANTNRADLTVAMVGDTTGALAGDTVTYQWQKRVDGGAWGNLGSATTKNITYGSFETDETTPTAVDLTVATGAASGSYKGRVWVVDLRLKATRSIAGLDCDAFSSPVTVKMVKMVDP